MDYGQREERRRGKRRGGGECEEVLAGWSNMWRGKDKDEDVEEVGCVTKVKKEVMKRKRKRNVISSFFPCSHFLAFIFLLPGNDKNDFSHLANVYGRKVK